jgi:hypothetical protein
MVSAMALAFIEGAGIMLYRCSNVIYDTSGEQVPGLPHALDVHYDGTEPETDLADCISDLTGWCVTSLSFRLKVRPNPLCAGVAA